MIIQKKNQQVQAIQLSGQKVVGQGKKLGTVYQLADGRKVLVTDGP
jgi:hypothetical protein